MRLFSSLLSRAAASPIATYLGHPCMTSTFVVFLGGPFHRVKNKGVIQVIPHSLHSLFGDPPFYSTTSPDIKYVGFTGDDDQPKKWPSLQLKRRVSARRVGPSLFPPSSRCRFPCALLVFKAATQDFILNRTIECPVSFFAAGTPCRN